MKDFLLTERKLFMSFIKESKLLIGVILFFVLLTYGIKLFSYDFSIDTEVIMNNYALQLSAWQSIDRIGLVFTKKLFFNGFNPIVANYLTYVMLIVVCVLLCYLVFRILHTSAKKRGLVIIPILFLTHPIFAEQFNFVLQSFEVSFAIFLLVCSLLCCFYFISTNHKIFAVVAILLSIWGFLTYQSLLLFFIAGSAASVLLILYQDRQVKIYMIIAKYIAIFLSSYILSQVLVRIVAFFSTIPRTSYLSRQILWGQRPVDEVVENIYSQIHSVLFAETIFYNYSFLISLAFVIVLIVKKILTKKKYALLELVCVIGLYLSPFLLTIFIGQAEAVRAQMPALQFVTAFSFYYLYLHVDTKYLQTILVMICVVFAFNQSTVTAHLLFSEHVKFQEDVIFANRLNTRLDELGVDDRSQYSLVIVGQHPPQSVLITQGETLGHSFFAWDIGTKQGTTHRALGFMRTLGYPFQFPTEKQLDRAHSLKDEMRVWPDKESIRMEGNLIIIKLSDA